MLVLESHQWLGTSCPAMLRRLRSEAVERLIFMGGDSALFVCLSSESLTAPKTLQEVQVPLIDRDACNSLFKIGSYAVDPQEIDPIKQDMICAGYPQGEKDSCQVRPCILFPDSLPPMAVNPRLEPVPPRREQPPRPIPHPP